MSTKFGVSAADASAIATVLAMSSVAMGGLGGEPFNDQFPGEGVTGNAAGVLIASDLEDRGCGYGYGYGGDCGPDTTLGIFDLNGFLIATDDDSSPLGNGFASGVLGLAITGGDNIGWAVSGYSDFDFDGLDDGTTNPHGQLGEWEAYADYYDALGNYITTDFIGPEVFVNGDEVFAGTLFNVPPDAATLDFYVDNGIGDCPCADVDYYTVSGLSPDTEYEIRVVSADFDTVLGLVDASGNIIDLNDDDPDAGCCLSVLNGTADADGQLRFVISGFPDFDFIGQHQDFGAYEISVSLLSPGCNAADLAEPFGLLDLADVTRFALAFTSQDPLVDFNGDNLLDLSDITTFVNAFLAGCP